MKGAAFLARETFDRPGMTAARHLLSSVPLYVALVPMVPVYIIQPHKLTSFLFVAPIHFFMGAPEWVPQTDAPVAIFSGQVTA